MFSAPIHALNMDVGHTLTTDSPFHVGTQKFAEILKEKSNGKINVTVFPHSQLGGELTMIQGAVAGATDLFVTGQPALNNVVKEFLVFDTPFLFDSVEQANDILAGPVGDKFMAILRNTAWWAWAGSPPSSAMSSAIGPSIPPAI